MLDWLLCFPQQSGDYAHLEKLAEAWYPFRKALWEVLLTFPSKEPEKAPPMSLELEITESRQLLAIVPTTFRFAAGVDLGLSFKTKLADALWGPDDEQRAATAAIEELLKGEQEKQDASSPTASTDYPVADEDSGPIAAG